MPDPDAIRRRDAAPRQAPEPMPADDAPVDPALFGGVVLNAEQALAARHLEGPALVLAGAGTGKTTALVGRYCHLLRQGVEPGAILATSFTRKAAEQLLRRIRTHGELGEAALPIGTFHSLCFRWLHDLGPIVGVPRDLTVIDEGGQYRLLRQLDAAQKGDVEDLKEAIGRFKDSLVTPTRAIAAAEQAPAERRADLMAVARAYERCDAALRRHGLYDFGDLIALTVAALRADEAARAAWSQRHRFLMIDEFQDINPAQMARIEALLDRHRNLWVVGDDDQAIYGWRGSDVRFIVELEVVREALPSERYRLTRAALSDIGEIITCIGQENPRTAKAFHEAAYEAFSC